MMNTKLAFMTDVTTKFYVHKVYGDRSQVNTLINVSKLNGSLGASQRFSASFHRKSSSTFYRVKQF
jgi:hypothetical protein